MSAIRVARGFIKRDAIVKFEGCYHGHADHPLVKAGSGLATFGVPTSAACPGRRAPRRRCPSTTAPRGQLSRGGRSR